MQFELDTPTSVKLLDIKILSQKDREPDANPGAALYYMGTFPNTVLTDFDGFLRGVCFAKAVGANQGTLDGVEPATDMPARTAIGEALGQFKWDAELTGYAQTVDYGLGAPGSNLDLEDGKLSGFKIKCSEGGTVQVKWKAEFPDVPAKTLGTLCTLKSQEVKLTQTAPEVKQDDLDEQPPAGRKRGGHQQPAASVH